jgi:hypothetical protein
MSRVNLLFAVIILRMKTMWGSIGWNVLTGFVPALIVTESVWWISKRWLASMEVRVS